MTIADRIQVLRKTKGISQEALADKLGVSRQAVSKWESEQSIPDMEKVIAMSDYFEVTTDYILKGIETSDQADRKGNVAGTLTIAATVFNFIGLILSAAVWYEQQTAFAVAIGLSLMAIGCMVFGIGTANDNESARKKAKTQFWSINIWLLSFIPFSFVYNILMGGVGAPYPIPVNSYIGFVAFWVVYISVCLLVDYAIQKSGKKK